MTIDHREAFRRYNSARNQLIQFPDQLIAIEKLSAAATAKTLTSLVPEARGDYDEASFLFPFWKNYPPMERGRQPRGDQYPWIEVGEHSIGVKLARALGNTYPIRDTGFPTGPDQRVLVELPGLVEATAGLISAVWLGIDIKSAGPRDDFPHTVMSPNQVSGSGHWLDVLDGVRNQPMEARGARSSHAYQPMLPPIIVLSDGQVALTVTMALKPIYAMDLFQDFSWAGQTLERLHLLTIPNGLLLAEAPNYLRSHPGLLFPGKDDNSVPILRRRARVSIAQLESIAAWRHQTIFDRGLRVT